MLKELKGKYYKLRNKIIKWFAIQEIELSLFEKKSILVLYCDGLLLILEKKSSSRKELEIVVMLRVRKLWKKESCLVDLYKAIDDRWKKEKKKKKW